MFLILTFKNLLKVNKKNNKVFFFSKKRNLRETIISYLIFGEYKDTIEQMNRKLEK